MMRNFAILSHEKAEKTERRSRDTTRCLFANLVLLIRQLRFFGTNTRLARQKHLFTLF
jgi:hypothetical protein